MGPWRTISVALKADASGIVQGTAIGSTAVKKFGADSERTLAQHNQSVARTGNGWRTVAKGIVGGLALVGIALGLSLHEAISWESAFAGVAKTVDGTTSQLSELEDGLLSMANRLPATREEIAGVAEAAGALGIQRGAILGFTEVMVGLGEATNLTADEAATMLAQFANIMGTSQTEFETLADTLVNLGNNGASTEKEILALAVRLAGAGSTIGLTEKQVFALANAMASMGIDAELGGGALSRVMRKIEVAVQGGGEGLLDFAKASGMSASEFKNAWDTDPAAALQTFLESMQDVQEAGGNMYGILADLGIKGTQDVDVISRLISGADGLATSFKDAESSSGALATEVEKRYATAESQLRVFRNRVTDVARIVGAQLIPIMLGALHAAEAFGRWLIDVGVSASKRLEGAWSDLQQAGKNIVDLLQSLWEGAKPVGTALAQMVGGAVIGAITTFADLLERTTNVLSDHSYLVYLVAGAYTALKVQAVGTYGVLAAGVVWDTITSGAHAAMASIAALRAEMQFVAITQGLTKPAAAVATLSSAITNLATTSVSAGAIAGGAFAGIAVGAGLATMALNSWQQAGEQRAREWLDSFTFDGSTIDSSMDSINKLRAKQRELSDDLDKAKGKRTGLGSLLGYGGKEENGIAKELLTVNAELMQYTGMTALAIRGAEKFGKANDLTAGQVQGLANRAGIDLVDAFDKNGKASKELQAEYDRTTAAAEAWGVTTADAAMMSTDQLELVEEAVKRIAETGDAAQTAWSSWSSILNATDDPVDPDSVKRSQEMVDDAKERVTAAEDEAAAGGQSADEAERTAAALQDARDALADATESHATLLATDSPLNAGKVQQFYADRLAEAETFTTDMNAAIAAGYDPQLLARLMAAGPEAAGPVLSALVEDTSASYVTSINNAERALSEFTAFATRQAQLTQRAIEVGTRQAAEDLGMALAIEQQSMANPNLTGAQIAANLGISAEDAQRIIGTFNLTVHVDADTKTAQTQINELTGQQRIAEIVGHASLETADDNLTEFERRERIAEIVAKAITEDATLGLDGVSAERIAEIVALAQTSYADGAIDDVAGQERIATIIAQAATREARGDMDELLESFDGKTATAYVELSLRAPWLTDTSWWETLVKDGKKPWFLGGDDSNRWGGITSYATGGIHRQATMGTGRGRVHWDEPATGKEAYVPMRGNKWRSISVLSEAASWFGMDLAPVGWKAANQQPPAPQRVPHGGAFVAAGRPATGGAAGPAVGELHLHGIEPDARKALREAELALGTYG